MMRQLGSVMAVVCFLAASSTGVVNADDPTATALTNSLAYDATGMYPVVKGDVKIKFSNPQNSGISVYCVMTTVVKDPQGTTIFNGGSNAIVGPGDSFTAQLACEEVVGTSGDYTMQTIWTMEEYPGPGFEADGTLNALVTAP